jgi:hypothetical protein
MLTERKFKEQEAQIARYRLLEREVTDPLAPQASYTLSSLNLKLIFRRIGNLRPETLREIRDSQHLVVYL